MRAVTTIRSVSRAFGWRGLWRRVGYMAGLRSGWIPHRTPVAGGYSTSNPVTWEHRFELDTIRAAYDALPNRDELRDEVVAAAQRVLDGQIELYGWADKEVGWPPRWHVNPFTGHEYPKVHWTAVSDNDPEAGDIKDVWELSRLPFTFLFTRAFVLSGDDRYPEAWWQAIEDWAVANPPNVGVNWRCGQETSLRAIALCFGLSVFDEHPATTEERQDLASRLLGASIKRVEPTLGYALSQRNNHAISELVFLLSVLGPQRQLCRLLLEVLDDQFYPDGSYAQQSFTYQRLAVQALQWLLVTRDDLPPGLRARIVDAIARSRDLLARCSDPMSGWLPNYGANDGALPFPLDQAHYRDFRPFLASLGNRPESASPSETELWLHVEDVAARRTDAAEQPSTYLTLRGPRSLLFSRAGTNGHRAGHADQLAVDLWIDGRNVVKDPGTYRYTAHAPWGNALTGIDVHSTVRAQGESLTRVGRFLSEPLPDAHVVRRKSIADVEVVVLERQAGEGTLQRVLVRADDSYVVIDRPDGTDAEVRWNLTEPDGPNIWLAPQEVSRASDPDEADPTSGWVSERYAGRQANPAMLLSIADRTVAVAAFTPEGVGWPLHNDIAAAFDGAVSADIVRAALPLLPKQDGVVLQTGRLQTTSDGSQPTRSIAD